MSTAKQEREMVARGEGCLGKAADDEPVFVLRGQDIYASAALSRWILLAHSGGKVPRPKLDEAIACNAAMIEWLEKHGGKYPD